jgi:hypothetical protein
MKGALIVIKILILLVVPVIGFSQAVKVDARLDTTAILIGDQTGMDFSFTAPAGTVVEWPSLPDTLMQSIQVVRRGKIDTTFSADKRSVTFHQKFTITSFDTGFYSIPQIPVYYKALPDTNSQREASPMLFLKVNTLAVDTTKAIKPIKGPMSVPITFREILPWLLIALAAVALVFVVMWYIRRRRKNKPLIDIRLKVQLKPHEIALKELNELRGKKLYQAGHVKQYHTEITDILRRYIEDRFLMAALESTTDEIITDLVRTGLVEEKDIKILKSVLTLADFVKFAKARPTPDENEESSSSAISFVTDTIPDNKEPKTSV